jgi:hypothetical protein
MDDQVQSDATALEEHEREDHWVADFITKLAGLIGNIGSKKH